MKSITSKLSIIILSLLAMAFTFVLGTTSSKAVGDDNSFQQCIAQVTAPMNNNEADDNIGGLEVAQLAKTDRNSDAIRQIISCANQQ